MFVHFDLKYLQIMSLKEAVKCIKFFRSWFSVYGFIHKTKNWLANTEQSIIPVV